MAAITVHTIHSLSFLAMLFFFSDDAKSWFYSFLLTKLTIKKNQSKQIVFV